MYSSETFLACVAGGISRECFCFGWEAVNGSGQAVRGLVKSRDEFPPAEIRRDFLNYAFTSAREFRIG